MERTDAAVLSKDGKLGQSVRHNLVRATKPDGASFKETYHLISTWLGSPLSSWVSSPFLYRGDKNTHSFLLFGLPYRSKDLCLSLVDHGAGRPLNERVGDSVCVCFSLYVRWSPTMFVSLCGVHFLQHFQRVLFCSLGSRSRVDGNVCVYNGVRKQLRFPFASSEINPR